MHSYILVTFFTFAKNSTLCGSQDLRIRLSKKYTFLNFLVSTLAILTFSSAFRETPIRHGLSVILSSIFYFIASLLTFIFLFYDHLCCCCCACCLGAGEWTVFDPENHQANLVWRNREIIDQDEEEDRREEEELSHCCFE